LLTLIVKGYNGYC